MITFEKFTCWNVCREEGKTTIERTPKMTVKQAMKFFKDAIWIMGI